MQPGHANQAQDRVEGGPVAEEGRQKGKETATDHEEEGDKNQAGALQLQVNAMLQVPVFSQ